MVRWLLTLQEYNFQVVYRSGKQNLADDALTRLPTTDDNFPEHAESLAIFMDDEPNPSSDTFDADEIAENIIEKQQNDSFCKAMMDYLLLNELPPDEKWLKKFSFSQDIWQWLMAYSFIFGPPFQRKEDHKA